MKKGDKIVLQEGNRDPQPGASYDPQIVWDLFSNYLDASEELGTGAAYRAKVSVMREKLLGPKIGKWGQIQEWMQDVDDPKNRHRHVAHLFAVHPGRQVNPVSTPELAAAAKVSLAWKDGSITGLRARGGFKVALTWRNGKLAKAVITSEKGGKACVRTHGKIQTITLRPAGPPQVMP